MAACLRHARSFTALQNKSCILVQYQGKVRQIPLGHRLLSSLVRCNVSGKQRHCFVGFTTVRPIRWGSSESTTRTASAIIDAASDKAIPTDYIPPPPPVPDQTDALPELLNALGEPHLSTMGLGGWTPSGLVQQALDAMHASLGLPWWEAIIIGTICIRLMMFPLVIKSQRNVAHMHNHMPTMTRLQEKFTLARQSGNAVEAAKAGHELMEFMKRNDIKPFRNFLVPLAQMPVFISVFVGLRQMANLPVESMKTGGIFWFTDLTLPDTFYAMPLMTMVTFMLTIEVGVDGVKAGTMNHNMKWFMRAMPLIMMPLISNFPAAMLCYWFTSNAFSLVQVLFLKIPAVRSFFKIQPMVTHPASVLPKKKGFLEGFKDSMSNAKLAQRMEERQRVDALNFRKAGQGPIQKTYSFDPTKVPTSGSSKPPVSAKPKS
ncbi:mitochondrial inner membrane protein OXA1L-like [Littorina saxatilis]|uniref:Membrane insertase YidC/Oxa/ALB C-terminal domain-containing protein n=1 Tax=Littorina saxatilis TaxID=31220 RepID=A0AAN9C156_9CAEN